MEVQNCYPDASCGSIYGNLQQRFIAWYLCLKNIFLGGKGVPNTCLICFKQRSVVRRVEQTVQNDRLQIMRVGINIWCHVETTSVSTTELHTIFFWTDSTEAKDVDYRCATWYELKLPIWCRVTKMSYEVEASWSMNHKHVNDVHNHSEHCWTKLLSDHEVIWSWNKTQFWLFISKRRWCFGRQRVAWKPRSVVQEIYL